MDLFQLFLGFSGRINRAKFWLAFVVYIAIVAVVGYVVYELDMVEEMPGLLILLAVVIYIPLIITGIAVGIKRLHDRDKSGWWLLVFYVLPSVLSWLAELVGPQLLFSLASFVFSIWGLVELGFLRGTAGPNKYGPDPLAS